MNPLTPLAIRIGSIPWLPKYLPLIVAIDRAIAWLSRGRLTLLDLAGLPNLTLEVVGRKSGISRSTPLLCVPDGGTFLVAGSNFGRRQMPAWVFNLRAADEVTLTRGGRGSLARRRELDDPERAEAWELMVRTWPNYAKYEQRTDRRIPIFRLTPHD